MWPLRRHLAQIQSEQNLEQTVREMQHTEVTVHSVREEKLTSSFLSAHQAGDIKIFRYDAHMRHAT